MEGILGEEDLKESLEGNWDAVEDARGFTGS